MSDYVECPRCGEALWDCDCTDDEIDEWCRSGYEEDEFNLCLCPFCQCANTVSVPGAICDECRAGAHQG